MDYIEFTEVNKHYGKNKVLDGISLSVDKHEVLGVLGPSGCGKTTLLRLLAGFERPDRGTIAIDGKKVFDKEKNIFVEPEYRDIAMVFQDLALWPHMTASQHLAFMLEAGGIHGNQAKESIAETLDLVGLERYAQSYPHELSGGEKQRLALARALSQKPKVMLLDEPVSNLDQILRKDIIRQLETIKKQLRLTMIYVTHEVKDISGLADRVAIIDKGKVIQCGEIEEITQSPANGMVADIMGIGD